MTNDRCLCADVHVGMTTVGKNWNPNCPIHPWNDRLQAQNDRAVELQRQAREARKTKTQDKGTTT